MDVGGGGIWRVTIKYKSVLYGSINVFGGRTGVNSMYEIVQMFATKCEAETFVRGCIDHAESISCKISSCIIKLVRTNNLVTVSYGTQV
jgi:hypothetical protein